MSARAAKVQANPAPARADGRTDDERPVFTAATGAGAG